MRLPTRGADKVESNRRQPRPAPRLSFLTSLHPICSLPHGPLSSLLHKSPAPTPPRLTASSSQCSQSMSHQIASSHCHWQAPRLQHRKSSTSPSENVEIDAPHREARCTLATGRSFRRSRHPSRPHPTAADFQSSRANNHSPSVHSISGWG